MENKREEPHAVHVPEGGAAAEDRRHQHRRYYDERKVIPIEEEAVTDAVHIDLSWRSWVRNSSRRRTVVADVILA